MGLETPAQGIGRVDPTSLIGHPDPSIVTPNATAALVEAYRNGVITADDISNRIGEIGKARRKAELTGLQEVVSPEAKAARASGLSAATAGNTFNAAAATAALPGVPAAAKAAEEDIDFHRAVNAYGPDALKSFFTYGPLVEGYSGLPKDADGKPDWMTAAKEGAALEKQVQLKSQAAMRATVHKQEQRQEGNTTYSVDLNATGEDITDPQKKQILQQQALAPLAFKFLKPGQTNTAPAASTPPQASTTPAVEPIQVTPDQAAQMRADLLNRGISEAAAMSDQDVARKITELPSPVAAATPSASPSATVEPRNNRPVVNQFIAGKGLVSKTEPGEKPLELIKETRSSETYRDWAKANTFYDSAKAAIDTLNSLPEAEVKGGSARQNAADIALTESVIKLYDPQGVVRQFKWDKIEQHQPWPDKIKNIVSLAVSRGTLTPEMRQSLAEIATDRMKSYEDSVRPQLKQTAILAQHNGYDPLKDGILSEKEASLVAGGGIPKYVAKGSSAAAATNAGPVITLESGQKVQRGADGQYYKVP